MASEASGAPPSTSVSDLPNPTRVITTTNLENGISSFDGSFEESLGVGMSIAGSKLRLAYATNQAPEVLDDSDLETYNKYLKNLPPLVVPGGGANIWYIDTPPGVESPMHRTVSLDFVIVIEGEPQLTLDSGETRMLKPGDITIQRGTMHKWANVSKDKWVRLVGIATGIEPITLNNGTKLGMTGLQ